MDTIQYIHDYVDNAVNRLKIVADEYQKNAEDILLSELDNDKDKDYTLTMKKLGFQNISLVKNYDKEKESNFRLSQKKSLLLSQAKNISNDVSTYKSIYPFHKFIYYSQLIPICEKYNLVLGPVNQYIGNIPIKNVKEISEFDYSKCNKKLRFNDNEPIFNQSKYSINFNNNNNNLYICAPKKQFNPGLSQIGIEIFNDEYSNVKLKDYIAKKKNEDPIVLLPVMVEMLGQIGFIVISKWGLESNDIDLQVDINN
jgi:hypothetical protein